MSSDIKEATNALADALSIAPMRLVLGPSSSESCVTPSGQVYVPFNKLPL